MTLQMPQVTMNGVTHEFIDMLVQRIQKSAQSFKISEEERNTLAAFVNSENSKFVARVTLADTDYLITGTRSPYTTKPAIITVSRPDYPGILGECSNPPISHYLWKSTESIRETGIPHFMRDIKEAADGVLLYEHAPFTSLFCALEKRGYELVGQSPQIWSPIQSPLDENTTRRIALARNRRDYELPVCTLLKLNEELFREYLSQK